MPRRSSSQLPLRSGHRVPSEAMREDSASCVSFAGSGVIVALLGIAPAWPSGRSHWSRESASGPYDPLRGDLDRQGWQRSVRRATDDPRIGRGIEHAAMARADDVPLFAQTRQDGTTKVRADGAV